MFPALVMLAVFVVALAGVQSGGVVGAGGIATAARLVIVLTLAAGLVCAAWQQRGLRRHRHAAPPANQVRLKSLSIRLGLVALLAYPALMALWVPGWPAGVFTFEYLVLLPFLLLAVPHYVRWAEMRMPQGEDAYFRFGQALTRQRPWRLAEHKKLLLAWMVKLFFIPTMYAGLVMSVESLVDFDWSLNPGVVVAGLFLLGLCFDLSIATGGYVFASRLLGTEVRNIDPSWLGWLVCIICYPPFVEIFRAIRAQTDNVLWNDWLLPSEPLYWLWAALVTLSWMVYWLSNASFGLRFSNLSWRGLVDHGPYRYSKHPGYIAKNIYWWLHTVPFVGVASSADLLRNLLGLSFVSLVYYLRAKTEERHLMNFPEYAAYAARIDREGIFAGLGRICRRVHA